MCDVRPAAEYLLAARRLLPRGAVARLHGKDRAADARVAAVRVRRDRLHHAPCGFEFRKLLHGTYLLLPRKLRGLDLLCEPHIVRILARERELCQSQRIRTVGGRFPGGDQLVCRCHRIMDLRDDFQHQVVCECDHRRPVLDVRAELDLH